MDLWLGLAIGLIIGWMGEWVLDRAFLRREHQALLAAYNRLHAESQQLRINLSGDQDRQGRLAELEQAHASLQSTFEIEAGHRAEAETRAAALQTRLSALEKEMGQLRERLLDQKQLQTRLAEAESELDRRRGGGA